MAIYRMIHVTYWQDPWIKKLKPDEKYFYLYLLTNIYTRQCGCYEIEIDTMVYETKLIEKRIKEMLKYFIDTGKIEYNPDTEELLLKNWLKYNSFRSPKVRSCIYKEIQHIKYGPFKDYVTAHVEGQDFDSLSIDYTWSIDSGQKKAKEPGAYTQDFEDFWNIYPRKEGKMYAFTKYKTAVKKMNAEDIHKAAQNYADDCTLNNRPTEYIKMASKFFEQQWHTEWVAKKPMKRKTEELKSANYKKLSGDE